MEGLRQVFHQVIPQGCHFAAFVPCLQGDVKTMLFITGFDDLRPVVLEPVNFCISKLGEESCMDMGVTGSSGEVRQSRSRRHRAVSCS